SQNKHSQPPHRRHSTSSDLPPTANSLRHDLLTIFDRDNNRCEDDEVIVKHVTTWLTNNKIPADYMFSLIYAQRLNVHFACVLAFLYRWGIGTNPDPEQAFKWYQSAAESGSPL